MYYPHQDGRGLPPAECCDRVCRLCPWPEGAYHLRKSLSGELRGGRVSAPWLPFIPSASCGLGSEPGTVVPAVTFGRDAGPSPPYSVVRAAGTLVSNSSQ